jgi:hypothetical protein
MASEEPSPEVTGPEGTGGRLVGALFSPRATFESVARKPSWLVPLLLLMAVSVTVVYSYSHRVGWRGFMEKQMAQNSRIAQMSPQQQKVLLERQVRLAPILGYAGSTVGTVVIVLVVAGLFLGAFNIVFGTTIRFKQSLGITTHAFLPGVVKGILGLVVIWAKPPEGIDLQNLVMSNAGAFLSANAANWMKALFTSFDLFAFWIMALLAVGYAAAGSSRKLKVGSALAVVVSLWLIWVLGIVGFTAMFS